MMVVSELDFGANDQSPTQQNEQEGYKMQHD